MKKLIFFMTFLSFTRIGMGLGISAAPVGIGNFFLGAPSITESKYYEKCPPGSYKGSIVVDPGNTYHFYRQNKDGTWSLSKNEEHSKYYYDTDRNK